MNVLRLVLVSFLGIGLAGCAGPSAFEAIKRLKADVGLLDQRVTQLERASVQGPPTSAWPTEPQPTAAGLVPAVAKPPATPTVTPSAASLGKLSKKEIQQANGLKVDGIVGRHTWVKLALHLNLTTEGGEPSATSPSK